MPESVPIYTILAACLASARSEAWCSPQLIVLDRAAEMIADDLARVYPRFDPHLFLIAARYQHDRLLVPRRPT